MAVNSTLIQDYIAKQSKEVCAFIYDLDFLSSHMQTLVAQLPTQVDSYYAIKANSDEAVLAALLPHVYGFEVASMGEIAKVRAVSRDVPIAFGGPGKTISELQTALDLNVELFHLESELQLARLNHLAAERGMRVKCLLRVNPHFDLPTATLQMAGQATQFGIDEMELMALLPRLSDYPHLEVIGFHFHCLSNNLDAYKHAALVRHYVQTAQQWATQFKLNLTTINVGGGIGVTYQPHEQEFDFARYCELLAQLCRDYPHLRLATECGRYISAECGVYLCEVTDIKQNHGQYFAVLRGGSHHFRLPSSWQHNHPFVVIARDIWPYSFARPAAVKVAVTLCGELCTPKDVLAKQVTVASLRADDIVMFQKAGAYGWHISHHDFLSHPHPERVYIKDQTLLISEDNHVTR
ncbi:type III PLP-dependent enzyme [Pseudoalteromonas fenneropenaei]|uniref:Type III PLP-dependent enzyme n=1 Tax=Pseudoalteromonas fenneropenaei TaxID=1737459 RepID=A0ABV7CJG4_9GAMM